MPAPRVVAIVGPTAAGKSELAIALALRLGGEVINTDAMQVYRGMDVGTAKQPVERRRGVAHHLLDLMEVTEPASVAVFQSLARAQIARLHSLGQVPVLVGGSALYTRAILDVIDFPGTDPVVRATYEARLQKIGSTELHRELAEIDPEAAASIEPLNGRRIVRALEVIELTGSPFKAVLPELTYHYPGAVQIGLRLPREVLDLRIEQRVEQMWASGLVDEVRCLGPALATSLTASRAIGYAQVLAFLRGEIDETEAQRQVVVATRRFVRRQDAWFLKDPRIHWLEADAADLVDQAVNVISRD